MQTALEIERCSMCHHDLGETHRTGHGVLTVRENDKQIVLVHCPHCGSLLIKVETVPVQSR